MMFDFCRSLALDKAKFAFTGFLACYWFHIVNWEEAITEKRIAILIKELEITKIRTSLLSESQEPENKSLVHSRKKEKKQRWAGLATSPFFSFFFVFGKKINLPDVQNF